MKTLGTFFLVCVQLTFESTLPAAVWWGQVRLNTEWSVCLFMVFLGKDTDGNGCVTRPSKLPGQNFLSCSIFVFSPVFLIHVFHIFIALLALSFNGFKCFTVTLRVGTVVTICRPQNDCDWLKPSSVTLREADVLNIKVFLLEHNIRHLGT